MVVHVCAGHAAVRAGLSEKFHGGHAVIAGNWPRWRNWGGDGRASPQSGWAASGADLSDVEIEVDLATAEERQLLVSKARAAPPDGLDQVLSCAGVSQAPPALTLSVNYFGAVAILEGLLPLLRVRPGGHEIAITSKEPMEKVEAQCVGISLARNERTVIRALETAGNLRGYASSKCALARWARQRATSADWAGSATGLTPLRQAWCGPR